MGYEQIENNPEFQMLLNSMSEGIVVQEERKNNSV